MEGIVVATYRCNARCHMCNRWQAPSKIEEEIKAEDLASLPHMKFCNITGGEPFLREDLEDIVRMVRSKADRVVISTNGYFTDRMVALAKKKIPNVGFRISIEGLPKANDELRGIKNGFDHGIRSLLKLKNLGIKDLGFGITVSDKNAKDLLELYDLAKYLKLEFATAIVHNAYYFNKTDNVINDKEIVIAEFNKLIRELFKTKRLKNWYRAYFNYGIINYIKGNKRLMPCEMGRDIFLVDTYGEVKACNVLDMSMGNIKQQSFDEIWNSKKAEEIRKAASECGKNCWMVGSVSPAMKKDLKTPTMWILKNKRKYLKGCYPD
jgi:MoaA/NifB/PqqE/SkfB family radical SAM enzyme